MDVILIKEVEKLGEKHDVVSVKPGYARNFLIPQGLAKIANSANRKTLDHILKREEARELEKLSEYKELIDSLQDKVIRIGAKAGTEGKIFGSVTTLQISQAIKEQLGVEIPRRKISLPEEVKTLGTYQADINFHKDVQGSVTFDVQGE